MAGSERTCADDVDVRLDRHLCGLARGLEQRPGDHFEAEVGEGTGDQVRAAVVSVLAHLGDHDAWLAAEAVGDVLRRFFRCLPAPVSAGLAVNAAHRLGLGAVAAERALQRVGDFSEGAAHARRFDGESEEIVF